MAETLRIPLRVVFYREDGFWFAHCLEFDLIGHGDTKEHAVEMLAEAIRLQVEATLESRNFDNLYRPAGSDVMRKFAAGKNIATGELEVTFLERIHVERDNVIIESEDYREYSGNELAPA